VAREAANPIWAAVNEFAVKTASPVHASIITRIYANVKGFERHLFKAGVIDNPATFGSIYQRDS